jgi:hypothetical protein
MAQLAVGLLGGLEHQDQVWHAGRLGLPIATDPVLTPQFLSDPRHHLAVAIDEGWVVGMASAVHYVHPDKAPQLFINEVAVTPPYQG